MTTSNSEKKHQFVNPFTENFIPHWEEWKYYKKEQHRFTYKPAGEMAAIRRLVKLSRGNEAIAIQMLEEASGNGWKGFFELKTSPNATNISSATSSNQQGSGSSSSARINAVKKF